jgi:hypothetical protein
MLFVSYPSKILLSFLSSNPFNIQKVVPSPFFVQVSTYLVYSVFLLILYRKVPSFELILISPVFFILIFK